MHSSTLPPHPAVGLQHSRDRSFDSTASSSAESSLSSSSSFLSLPSNTSHRSTRSRAPRPLPLIPHPLSCKTCRTCITSTNVLLPPSAVPQARGFKGFAGKAWLFTDVNNVSLSRPGAHLMSTGVHTMQEITCGSCSTYLGWKIVRAHNRSERWKEGYHLLELEHLHAGKQETQLLYATLERDTRRSSDSEDSS
ncbi:hypothetical protein HGRIS_002128 [Hohenbuehelia grisea]|uniref:Yippee domain-containing protein n=1 Tax=Hohenbuehelia grisea TaxID=104357 RepID=A0ABR3JK05_9AGAR